MSVRIAEQGTPNPHAMKYILSVDVLREGKATFASAQEAGELPMAAALFAVPGVRQVHFFENVITVTQDGYGSLGEPIFETIRAHIDAHDIDFNTAREAARQAEHADRSPDLQAIEAILDEKIRPALQMDGGDLDVIEYDRAAHRLTVNYQGACGSCPSASAGTLMAIQGILRDEFDPEIEVLTQGGEMSFAY